MTSLASSNNGTLLKQGDDYKSLSQRIVALVREDGVAVCVLGTPPSIHVAVPLVNITPFDLVSEFHIDDFTEKRVRGWLYERRRLRAFRRKPLGIWATREIANESSVFIGWGGLTTTRVALRLHRRYPQYGPLVYLEPHHAPN